MSVQADPAYSLVFDMGTGLAQMVAAGVVGTPGRVVALVTHLHFDHVQGLPFFSPVHEPDNSIEIYGPMQETGSLHDALAGLIRPPYFPLPLDQFPASIRFHDVVDHDFRLGDTKVKVRPVPHVGPTVGYRVEHGGSRVAYVSDHQAPVGQDTVADSVLELCDGVDLLIHDAQYTDEEFSRKANWGHCTVDYAVFVAKQAGARRLCLFHHDPSHGDEALDGLLEQARAHAGNHLDEVIAASEGMTVDV